MFVNQFKKFLQRYGENDLIINVFADYLKNASHMETEIALQSAFDRLKKLAIDDKFRCYVLEQQLYMTKSYLKGEMYTDEETAKKMLNKQIENIEGVLK